MTYYTLSNAASGCQIPLRGLLERLWDIGNTQRLKTRATTKPCSAREKENLHREITKREKEYEQACALRYSFAVKLELPLRQTITVTPHPYTDIAPVTPCLRAARFMNSAFFFHFMRTPERILSRL